MYLIGLDIGTSGTKALCVDETGRIIEICRVSYSFRSSGKGIRELDPEEVWLAVRHCVKAVSGSREIESITVSALGEAIIGVDCNGKCLTMGITGTDVRGRELYRQFIQKIGGRKMTEITGLPVDPLYSLGKILWMKKEAPRLFDGVWKIFTFQDFAVYRLCGETLIDVSMASRTALFNYQTQEWSEWLFTQAGLPKSLFSRTVPSGYPAGHIRQKLRHELGIRGKARIIVGCHDHIANAIGAGAYKSGDCVNAAGTTEGLTSVIEPAVLDGRAIEKYHMSCEPFAAAGMYNTVAWSNASGSILQWFVKDILKRDEDAAYDSFNRNIKYEPSHIYVLPHFSGAATPHMDEYSKGAMLGLTLESKPDEIYQAIVEGTQMELYGIYRCLQQAGVPIDRMIATGGVASEEILQMKADILGCQIHTVKCRETGAAGGAILGAAACGIYKNLGEAVSGMVTEKKCFVPDLRRHRAYEVKLKLYDRLYTQLREIVTVQTAHLLDLKNGQEASDIHPM